MTTSSSPQLPSSQETRSGPPTNTLYTGHHQRRGSLAHPSLLLERRRHARQVKNGTHLCVHRSEPAVSLRAYVVEVAVGTVMVISGRDDLAALHEHRSNSLGY